MALGVLAWLGIALLIFVIILVAAIVWYYNRFIVLKNRIENSFSQIDVQLHKRADLVPNLVKAVKGYAKHEKGIMKDVTEARKALLSAKTFDKRVKAGNELQSALKSIFAIAEGYPDLKANQNFLHLQEELSAIEDKIAYARQFYNDSILAYNNMTKTFPGRIPAGWFGFKPMDYHKIPTETRAVPKVDF